MTLIQELRDRETAITTQARALLNTATTEQRDLSATEAAAFDRATSDLESLRSRIAQVENDDATRSAAEATLTRILGPSALRGAGPEDAETLEQFQNMLLRNDPAPITVRSATPRSRSNPGAEARALSTTSPAKFGAVSFYDQIVESLVSASSVLAAGATVVTTSNGEVLRIPRATALSTATITGEGAALTESDPTLSAVELGAHKYGVLIKVSREALDDTGTDLQGYLARETGTALGLALGAHLISGTGTGQPRGVLADATSGVTGPTGTATSFGAQGTAGQGTDLLNSLYASVAEGYLASPSVGFLARGVTIAAVRNLKATTGELVGHQYLSTAPAPFYPDAFVPAMAAGAKSVLFGDWSRYFVRIVNGIRFERSDERYFDTDQVGFRAILRADGALIDPSAIKYFAHSAT